MSVNKIPKLVNYYFKKYMFELPLSIKGTVKKIKF